MTTSPRREAFTAGEWESRDGHIREVDVPFTIIATMREFLPRFRPEQEANARLIAAAPDLYEAADFALNAIIGCAVTAGGVDDRRTLLEAQDKLRAALAKASEAAK